MENRDNPTWKIDYYSGSRSRLIIKVKEGITLLVEDAIRGGHASLCLSREEEIEGIEKQRVSVIHDPIYGLSFYGDLESKEIIAREILSREYEFRMLRTGRLDLDHRIKLALEALKKVPEDITNPKLK